ncbi:peptidoglycan DD-metalloendopeptidase family protein [Candidatus Kaiserbacteria bacterium]|nr:peptidoglycan DD-metalloendopeptidase family protein [Candidatus Kaiserbacteria bacterium]
MHTNHSNNNTSVILFITTSISSLIFLSVLLLPFVLLTPHTSAATVEELKKEISDFNAKIAALEAEIAQYEAELNVIGSDKQTLNNAIKELDISRRKLLTNIKITQNQIYSTTLQIQELGEEIEVKGGRIENDTNAVAEAIRRINEIESQSMIEAVLGYDNLDQLWNQLETLQRFQTVVRDQLKELKQLKGELEDTKTSSEKKKIQLTSFNSQLSGQKTVLEGSLSEKNVLLNQTVKKESEYQKLLNERVAARELFENEMLELESQLRVIIDPSSIPPVGSGILRWPFSNSQMTGCKVYEKSLKNIHCITQYFGNTAFASKNPQVYNGGGHNGVDFRASVGTKIQSALSGTIVETGNTDAQKGCYSYGKWILVKHNNGLSTLYAHLSYISVKAGQTVSTGDVIGFSGNTGYSTGPHLHFTVFASQGVNVVRLGDVKKITNCGNVRIPVASLNAYLNPLSYL